MDDNIELLIRKHFPNVSEKQMKQFLALKELYLDWNAKINVISRKDTESFNEHHLLHSLGLAVCMKFEDGARVLDIGTGGGFPGIPLAILFPNVHFTLADSIGKKIKVVQEVADAIGLTNVRAIHSRVEDIHENFDFTVSRAVTRLGALLQFSLPKLRQNKSKIMGTWNKNTPLYRGIICIKGGDLEEEILESNYPVFQIKMSDFYNQEFFETKKVLLVNC